MALGWPSIRPTDMIRDNDLEGGKLAGTTMMITGCSSGIVSKKQYLYVMHCFTISHT